MPGNGRGTPGGPGNGNPNAAVNVIQGTFDDDVIDQSGSDRPSRIFGRAGHDEIIGSQYDDVIHGDQGDDLLAGMAGDDNMNGGQGIDTALFSGSVLDFSWSPLKPGAIFVTDENTADGDEGTDLLTRFEYIQFDDYRLDIFNNNAPFVVASDQSTDEDTPAQFTFDAYDFDGGTLSISGLSFTGGGTLALDPAIEVLTPIMGIGARYTLNFDPGEAYQSLALGESAVETVSLQVSDGQGGVTPTSFDVTIEGLNDGPVGNNDEATTDEDTAVVVSVLANDTDVDNGAILSIAAIDTGGTIGTVTDNGDGTVTYDPNGQFESLAVGETANDTFSYTVTDEHGATDTATVSVTVNGVNDDPTANDDAGSTDEGSTTTISVLINDSDVDNGAILSVASIDTTGTIGTVIDNGDGTLTYDPNGQFESLAVGETANDTFTYTVTDQHGGTDTATVTVTVNGLNDTPDAAIDSASTPADTAVDIDVLANDSDPDATDVLTVQSFTSPEFGTVTDLGGGNLRYTPNPGFVGVDSFSYTISDGNGGTDTAEVRVNVGGTPPANTAPIGRDGEFDFTDSAPITLDFNTLEVNGQPIIEDFEQTIGQLTITSIEAVTEGRFEVEFIETGPDTDVFMLDPSTLPVPASGALRLVVNYEVDDGQPTDNTDTGQIILNISQSAPPSNSAPVAGDATITEDETLPNGDPNLITVDLLGDPDPSTPPPALATDPDGDLLTVTSLVFTDAGGNTLPYDPLDLSGTSLVGGVFTVNPIVFGVDDGVTEVFQAHYTVSDGSLTDSGVVTFNITGTAENSAPVAQDGSDSQTTPDDIVVGTNAFQVDLNALVSDPDLDVLTITLDGVFDTLGTPDPLDDTPVTATILDGVVSIPVALLGLVNNESRDLRIEYTVSDGALSDSGTVDLTVNGPVTPTGVQVVDFEEFAPNPGASQELTDIGGLIIEGNALAFETDELGGGRAVPPGLLNGQTTTSGTNVGRIEGVLDGTDAGGNPLYTFSFYAPNATARVGDGPFLTLTPETFFGEAFDFDGMSLTALDGPDTTVTIIPYRIVETSLNNFELVAVEAAGFDVNVSSTTPNVIDFTSAAFQNAAYDDPRTAAVETGAFENIAAVQIVTTGVNVQTDPSRPGTTPVNDDPLVIDDLIFDFG